MISTYDIQNTCVLRLTGAHTTYRTYMCVTTHRSTYNIQNIYVCYDSQEHIQHTEHIYVCYDSQEHIQHTEHMCVLRLTGALIYEETKIWIAMVNLVNTWSLNNTAYSQFQSKSILQTGICQWTSIVVHWCQMLMCESEDIRTCIISRVWNNIYEHLLYI